jgi:hypothetical protein
MEIQPVTTLSPGRFPKGRIGFAPGSAADPAATARAAVHQPAGGAACPKIGHVLPRCSIVNPGAGHGSDIGRRACFPIRQGIWLC